MNAITKLAHNLQEFFNHYVCKEKLVLASLVLLALLIRLTLMIILKSYRFPNERSMGYEMGFIAEKLVLGEGFKIGDHFTAWMAPLYPFLMGLIFRFFGIYSTSSAIVILILQSIISSIAIIPLFALATQLFDREAGYLAGLIWAFHPGSIYYSVKFIWSSSLTVLGLTFIVLLFVWLSDRRSKSIYAVLCGVAIALTALNDPVILTVLPFAGLWLLWRTKDSTFTTISRLIVMAITAFILLLPWTLRNYLIFHDFVPIKDTFGANLWLGNHAPNMDQSVAALGMWNQLENLYSEDDIAYLLSLDEVDRDHVLEKRAVDFIITHPQTFITYTLDRIYLFWRQFYGHFNSLVLAPYYLMVWLGIISSSWRWRSSLLLIIVFLVFPIPYYISIASFHRFRFPLEGILAVYIAGFLSNFIKKVYSDFSAGGINKKSLMSRGSTGNA